MDNDETQGAAWGELPLPALALIYQYCDAQSHKALLRVARWGRDTVLREASSLQLTLHHADTASTAHHLAALLSRACTSAEPGQLCVKIQAAGVPKGRDASGLLSALVLRPGSDQGGWPSVRALHLSALVSLGSS
jgi:hypothetical protein